MAKIRDTFYTVGAPCTIALLTDIHNRPDDRITASLERNRPDVICIAGDLVYGTPDAALDNQKNALPLLEHCMGIAPVFLSLGNHDWVLDPAALERITALGVTVLDDRWVQHQGIWFAGMTSATVRKRRIPGWEDLQVKARPHRRWLRKYEQLPGYKVLLCHHPEYFPRYIRERDINLVLSGHAHGGQWRICGQGLMAPGQGFLPKLTAGVYEDRLVVSRGLMNTSWVPRINDPVEIVYLS